MDLESKFQFFFVILEIRGSHFLYLRRNLERNNLSGSIPANLLEKSKSGSLALRFAFCHNSLSHLLFSLLYQPRSKIATAPIGSS